MMAFILATDFDFIAYMSTMAFLWKLFSRQWRFWNMIILHFTGLKKDDDNNSEGGESCPQVIHHHHHHHHHNTTNISVPLSPVLHSVPPSPPSLLPQNHWYFHQSHYHDGHHYNYNVTTTAIATTRISTTTTTKITTTTIITKTTTIATTILMLIMCMCDNMCDELVMS